MTRPTDDQIAALLRELANCARPYGNELEDTGDIDLAYMVHGLEFRARAMADELEGKE